MMDVSLVIRQCYLHSGHENKGLITVDLFWHDLTQVPSKQSFLWLLAEESDRDWKHKLIWCIAAVLKMRENVGSHQLSAARKQSYHSKELKSKSEFERDFFFHSLQTRTQLDWHFNFSLDALSRALGSYRSRQMTCRTLNWKISVVSSHKVYGNLWCSDGKWI